MNKTTIVTVRYLPDEHSANWNFVTAFITRDNELVSDFPRSNDDSYRIQYVFVPPSGINLFLNTAHNIISIPLV